MKAIYIHIPFCRSRCHYCTFTSSCDYSHVDSYIDNLCNNMVVDDSEVDSIFIGGGTPSTLQTVHFDKIFEALHRCHNITTDAEITVECNPDSIDSQLMQCLVGHGVNRISIGLQSVNNDTLVAIGRRHDYATFVRALRIVHEAGIDNVNVDIMVGLPESYSQFVDTVSTVATLDITHVSMYALELYPDSKLYSMVASNQCHAVADDDSQAQWYDKGMQILASHGYSRYEVSNFAKQGYQCRHNLHYWHCDQYHGYGVSAHGYIDGVRYSNSDSIMAYNGGLTNNTVEVIDKHSAMIEYMMLGLRLDSGVSRQQFLQLFGVDMLQQFPNISTLVGGGQLVLEGDMLYVATSFTYVLTAILAEIL